MMYNLYIPLCGLVLSIILFILYIYKVKNITTENKLYFLMIIDTIIMEIFCMAAVYLIYIGHSHALIKFTNRVECFAIVNYFMNLMMPEAVYTVLVSLLLYYPIIHLDEWLKKSEKRREKKLV